MNEPDDNRTADIDTGADDSHKGLKEKVTEAVDTVKERIREYHEQVDND